MKFHIKNSKYKLVYLTRKKLNIRA